MNPWLACAMWTQAMAASWTNLWMPFAGVSMSAKYEDSEGREAFLVWELHADLDDPEMVAGLMEGWWK